MNSRTTSAGILPGMCGRGSLAARFAAKVFKLDQPTCKVAVDKDLPVPMRDGTVLLADRIFPRGGGQYPTVLVRSPYGRAGIFQAYCARPYAQRGFNVVIQSCRGTNGSGGTVSLAGEREDGLDTLAWLKTQPWFDGRVGTAGASYLGIVQWAMASEAGPELKAIAPQVSASALPVWQGGILNLEMCLLFAWMMDVLGRSRTGMVGALIGMSRFRPTFFDCLPLGAAADNLRGPGRAIWTDLISEVGGAGAWANTDHSSKVKDVAAAAHLTGGWHDMLLTLQLADYTRLRDAGRDPYLTIGPWPHSSIGGGLLWLRESLLWMRAQLAGEIGVLRESAVRLYVMGAGVWRDFESWPPPSTSEPWYLQGAGGLSRSGPTEGSPDSYRYDPADPTPALGGPLLKPGAPSVDNRKLEARGDVLTYTSGRLQETVEVIGPVSANISFASSLEHADVFVRLCDVFPSGKSMNITEGIVRLTPEAGPANGEPRRVVVELAPTAYSFRPGNRIRVQVSSGAHPRFARNLGTGEPPATATETRVAEQRVFHDPDHPSSITLPVCRRGS